MTTKTQILPCHEIAAEYLGVEVRELPPGLAWRLTCADERLRKMGSALRSRQAVAAIVEGWMLATEASFPADAFGRFPTPHERFFGAMPEGFWSDV